MARVKYGGKALFALVLGFTCSIWVIAVIGLATIEPIHPPVPAQKATEERKRESVEVQNYQEAERQRSYAESGPNGPQPTATWRP